MPGAFFGPYLIVDRFQSLLDVDEVDPNDKLPEVLKISTPGVSTKMDSRDGLNERSELDIAVNAADAVPPVPR